MAQQIKERCIYCGSDVYYTGSVSLLKCSMCGHTLIVAKFESELARMKEAIEEGEQAKKALRDAEKEAREANERLIQTLSSLDSIKESQQQEAKTAEKLAADFAGSQKEQAAMAGLIHSISREVTDGNDMVRELLTALSAGQSDGRKKLESLQYLAARILQSQDSLAARLQMQSDIVTQLQSMSIEAKKRQELVEGFMAWSQDIQLEDYERLETIESSTSILLESQKAIDKKVDSLHEIALDHQKTLEEFQSQWKLSQLEELKELYHQAENFQYDRKYDRAEEYYRKVITKGGGDAEVYWRLLLCHYCISYQREDDGRLIPIILNPDLTDPEEMSVRRDLESHMLPGETEYYREELEKIDRILDKYRQVRTTISYDVFISVKQQKNGRATIDSDIASTLYDTLTGKGLKVFNSRRCRSEMAGKLYEPYIISALMSSKALIVVGTCAENMESQWVRNEWTRFQWLQKREIQRSGKTDRLLLCYLGMGMDPGTIPRALEPGRQAIIDGINADKEITAALSELISKKHSPSEQQTTGSVTADIAGQESAGNISQDNKDNSLKKGLVIGGLVTAIAAAAVIGLTGILSGGNKEKASEGESQQVQQAAESNLPAETETAPVELVKGDWHENILREEHGAVGDMPENGDIADPIETAFGVEAWKRDEITSICFLDSLDDAPENAVDLSEAGDGKVLGWLDEDNTLYIGGNGGVKANPDCGGMFAWYTNVRSIVFDGKFHTDDVTDMRYLFYHCYNLEKIDFNGIDTSNVKTMSKMFVDCNVLDTINFSGFDTSDCVSFYQMFDRCYGLHSLDLRSFNTQTGYVFDRMFYDCENLEEIRLDPALFTIGQAGSAQSVFSGCEKLTSIDLSGFDLSNVKQHKDFFKDCPLKETYGVDGDGLCVSAALILVSDTGDSLNLRSKPGHDSSLIATIYDDQMYFQKEVGEGKGSDGEWHYWYNVSLTDGTTGWVRSDLVKMQEQDGVQVVLARAVDSDLNIRALPKHDSDLAAVVSRDDEYFDFDGRVEDGLGSDGQVHAWYHVNLDNGTAGWVRSDLVVIVG